MDNQALNTAVQLLKSSVLSLAPRDQRPLDWASTQDQLGRVFGILGQCHLGTRYLQEAIVAFEAPLDERDRDHHPLAWAANQNHLGNALGILAQHQGDTEMLEQAVAAFERALQKRTQEETP